ncbi:MAG: metalloregulator ArsR/SmtB family transcription factor [Gammaproteobacteria bacterium]|nr:metalloregulator ArsR/SmtB family transcription factor [Gammaproteobacteria bacterium]MCZ6856099.1 metalloregulator ArsR/SmtB family transcription factor [Gammaproteobacteria bacterium]
MSRDAYTAIADPTRRQILELLRGKGTLMAGEIAGNFASASRPGISRHLRVLKECGVVTSTRDGKSQNYTLNPKPLNDILEGWLGNFAQMQVESLSALRRRVEQND